MTYPTITPWPADRPPPAMSRTGSLVRIGAGEIQARLGFAPERDSIPGKTDHEWTFLAGGQPCGIWDFKGSDALGFWSTSGPPEVFAMLFGWRAGP